MMLAAPRHRLYGNITTKSNTYQIAYRVQTLKQTPNTHSLGDFTSLSADSETYLVGRGKSLGKLTHGVKSSVR